MEVSEAPSDPPQVSFKKRGPKTTQRKRPATPPPAADSESDFTSSEDEEGRQIKRRRKNVGLAASSKNESGPRTNEAQANAAPRARPVLIDSDVATKTSNWYDESGEKASDPSKKAPADENTASDGTYKGAANYSNFIQKNPDRAAKQVGPLKSSTNVRTITVTDFAPDVCKDYKQTGWCGFGDSCKFLHAREDYKQGWQLDKDWEVGTKGKKIAGKTVASANRSGQAGAGLGDGDDEDDEALLESIPFACIVCKKSYTNPIITKCGHYFCEACALKRYRKDPSCAACGSGTGGVFNTAKKLTRLLERKREKARDRREKALKNGEDVSEGEGEEEEKEG